MYKSLIRICSFFLSIILSNSAFSQRIDASLNDGILDFEPTEIGDHKLSELKSEFSNSTPLSESGIETLYGEDYIQNANKWYMESGVSYNTSNKFEIIPIELKEFNEFSVFVFKRTPDFAEDYNGEAITFRYLSNGQWNAEIFFHSGKANLHDISCEFEWRNKTLHVHSLDRLRPPGGLMYYTNTSLDIPLSVDIIMSSERTYERNNGSLILSNNVLSDIVNFNPDQGFEEHLQAYGNGDAYIKLLLNSESIDYDKKYKVVDAIVQLQNNLLPNPVPNTSFLKIIGSNIWVRDSPSTGEVVMKLTDGDMCLVLQRGKYEEIRGMEDYWYEIVFKGEKGWVYGSQTTLNPDQEMIEATDEPEPIISEGSEKELLDKNSEDPESDQKGETPSESENELSPAFAIAIVAIIIIVVLTILGGATYFVFRLFKGSINHIKTGVVERKDMSKLVNDDQVDSGVKIEVDRIITRLDLEREVYHGKAKKVFPRAFLKVLLTITLILLTMTIVIKLVDGEPVDISPEDLVPMLVFSLIVSLFFSGIYTVFGRSRIWQKFSLEFKNKLIPPILALVDPGLQYFVKGISEEEYFESALFYMRLHNFDSGDRIEGMTETGAKIIISECRHRNKIKHGKRVGKEHVGPGEKVSSRPTFYECFSGLMVILELNQRNESSPVKILPEAIAKKHYLSVKEEAMKRYEEKSVLTKAKYFVAPRIWRNPKLDRIDENHRVDDGNFMDGKYHIYAENGEEGSRYNNEKFEKLLKYITGKYGEDKVFVSIANNKLYLALDMDKDLFEPEMFLKKKLAESGVGERILNDMLFVKGLVKEVSLFLLADSNN